LEKAQEKNIIMERVIWLKSLDRLNHKKTLKENVLMRSMFMGSV